MWKSSVYDYSCVSSPEIEISSEIDWMVDMHGFFCFRFHTNKLQIEATHPNPIKLKNITIFTNKWFTTFSICCERRKITATTAIKYHVIYWCGYDKSNTIWLKTKEKDTTRSNKKKRIMCARIIVSIEYCFNILQKYTITTQLRLPDQHKLHFQYYYAAVHY